MISLRLWLRPSYSYIKIRGSWIQYKCSILVSFRVCQLSWRAKGDPSNQPSFCFSLSFSLLLAIPLLCLWLSGKAFFSWNSLIENSSSIPGWPSLPNNRKEPNYLTVYGPGKRGLRKRAEFKGSGTSFRLPGVALPVPVQGVTVFRYAASFPTGLDAFFHFLASFSRWALCIALAVQVGWAVSALLTKTGSALDTSEERVPSASPWLVSLPCPPDWVVWHSHTHAGLQVRQRRLRAPEFHYLWITGWSNSYWTSGK